MFGSQLSFDAERLTLTLILTTDLCRESTPEECLAAVQAKWGHCSKESQICASRVHQRRIRQVWRLLTATDVKKEIAVVVVEGSPHLSGLHVEFPSESEASLTIAATAQTAASWKVGWVQTFVDYEARAQGFTFLANPAEIHALLLRRSLFNEEVHGAVVGTVPQSLTSGTHGGFKVISSAKKRIVYALVHSKNSLNQNLARKGLVQQMDWHCLVDLAETSSSGYAISVGQGTASVYAEASPALLDEHLVLLGGLCPEGDAPSGHVCVMAPWRSLSLDKSLWKRTIVEGGRRSMKLHSESDRLVTSLTFGLDDLAVSEIRRELESERERFFLTHKRCPSSRGGHVLAWQMFPFSKNPEQIQWPMTSARRKYLTTISAATPSWLSSVLREMVALPHFRGDPEWICEALSFSVGVQAIKKTLHNLVETGFLEFHQESGSYRRSANTVRTSTEIEGETIVRFHEDILFSTIRALEEFDDPVTDFRALHISIGSDDIPSAKDALFSLAERLLHRESQVSAPHRIVQINLQLFPDDALPCDASGTKPPPQAV